MTMLAYSPHLLVVHPSVPANNLKELVALSKKQPLNFAVSGVVVVPTGATPKGGRPVVTWAHGTTGVADQCAHQGFVGLGVIEFVREPPEHGPPRRPSYSLARPVSRPHRQA